MLNEHFKEEIRADRKTLIIVEDDKVVLEDQQFGVISLVQAFGDKYDNIVVYDKLIGKAAAMLLLQYNPKYVYAKIITKEALKLLEGITVEYDRVVENILNRDKSDLCPIEKIASTCENLETLYQKLFIFYHKLGVLNDKNR